MNRRAFVCIGLFLAGLSPLAQADCDPLPQQAISPTVISDGVVTYAWRDGVAANVFCPPQRTCDIRLIPGEHLQDVVSPGSVKNIGQFGWTIDLGKGEAPYIYVTPVDGSPATNMIITTNVRRYSIVLTPKFTAHTSYAIIDNRPLPSPSASPSPTPVPTDYLFSIEDPMHAPFAPTVLPEREGDLTIVRLPPGYYAKPDVAQYDEHGKNWQIIPVGESWDPDRNAYVVAGIYPALVLYIGEGKDQLRVIIRRKSA